MSMLIHRAVYGERDGAHDLLCTSLPAPQRLAALRGLVDRPPGTIPPGMSWSPLLGCMPIGGYFALWRILEDRAASRRGMVQSHVLLVASADVAAVSDLEPLLAVLPKEVVVQPEAAPLELTVAPSAASGDGSASFPLLVQLANLLVDLKRSRPVVYCDDAGDFDVLLRALWRSLFPWPELRLRLTCWPALEPGTLQRPSRDLIVITPQGLSTRWTGFPLIERQRQDHKPASPAAELILGTAQTDRLSFLQHFTRLPSEFALVGKLAYAASCWHDLTQGTAATLEIPNLLRVVGQLAPEQENASSLKVSLLSCASQAKWEPDYALALANVDLEAYGSNISRVTQRLRQFAVEQMTHTRQEDSYKLVARSVQRTCMPWWEQALRMGVSDALQRHAPALFRNLFRWWSQEPRLLNWVLSILPATSQVEKQLSDACPDHIATDLAEAVATAAMERDWRLLHAVVLGRVLAPEDLLRRQLALRGGPGAGLGVLVTRCPPHALLAECLRAPLPDLVLEVGRLAAAHPALLAGLDPQSEVYRKIWLIAARASGDPWLGIPSRQQVLFTLMDMLLESRPVEEELLQCLSSSPHSQLLSHPRRAELWNRMPSSSRDGFLRATAQRLLDEPVHDPPEEPLRAHFVRLALRKWAVSPVPARSLLTFATRYSEVSESDFRTCLCCALSVERIDYATAEELGQLCVQRTWRDSVKSVALIQNRDWRRSDLDPLLHKGRTLFGLWDRLLELAGIAAPPEDQRAALLELAVRLYPRGQQQRDLWERAGGKTKELPDGHDAEERWRAALRLIQDGAGPPAGLVALLGCMVEDYPHNHQLQRLRALVTESSPRKRPTRE